MILIYGKNKVGSAVADLCTYLGLDFEMRDDTDGYTDFSLYHTIVPSPGVPGFHPIYQTGKVISELDFAYKYLPKAFQIISITGTDGKSTTTWMMYNILQKEYIGKKKVYISGNFEIPFSSIVLDILRNGEKKGIIVVEISSFMSYALIGMDNGGYTSDYTIFTNFKPDHLNWHMSLQEYLDAKMNLVKYTKKTAIMHDQILDFTRSSGCHIDIGENVRIFGEKEALPDRTDGESIIISKRQKYRLSDTHFSGKHNALNILSCALVASEMGLCSKRVRGYITSISGLPHRIEFVVEKRGVRCIDDSKSTSCQSLVAALSAFSLEKTILIAGGSDKGDTFDDLMEASIGLKFVILFGETRDFLSQKFIQAGVGYSFADSMSDAVGQGFFHAEKGDILLLSPGCASFGLFRDYLDRAEQFRACVEKIPD